MHIKRPISLPHPAPRPFSPQRPAALSLSVSMPQAPCARTRRPRQRQPVGWMGWLRDDSASTDNPQAILQSFGVVVDGEDDLLVLRDALLSLHLHFVLQSRDLAQYQGLKLLIAE